MRFMTRIVLLAALAMIALAEKKFDKMAVGVKHRPAVCEEKANNKLQS